MTLLLRLTIPLSILVRTLASVSETPLGIYCTGAWYRSIDGQIYYGKEDTAEYKANTLNQGYQVRQCLDLRLRHTAEQEWASLVDENGVYDEESLWLPTIDHNFGEGGFITLEEAGINVPSTSRHPQRTARRRLRKGLDLRTG